ncbi:MarR family transcriptional regulator [Thermosipho affectus]|uniref:MarR family transcriptional regulator n=1 Tax=Thermosipho affectus TaxID=660294 RepID=A0ABX3IIU7_9BACT|nr:MarR family winged helix-turn-helix transcriptional regulator [Thermosipho affectus]ONN27738.1 MarR family transcriptional regulator [Thermosipho affectus]
MKSENFENAFLLFSEIEKLKFQILRADMEKYGIHPGQIPLFFIVKKFPGITQKKLAERIMVNTSTVAIMLKRMEKAGFVKKVVDEKDRRYFHVYLTDKAEEIHEKLLMSIKKFESACFKDFSKGELNHLEKLLEKVVKNLEAMKDGKNF